MKTYSLIIFAYPGVQKSAVYGMEDVFTISNRLSRAEKGAEVAVTIMSRDDLLSVAPKSVDALLLPPNLSGQRAEEDGEICQILQAYYRSGSIMCSVCAGAFWLGKSGLLENRPATTHWGLENEFRTSFPNVHLNPEQLLIDDHDVITAGGLMAWVDLSLHLVQRWQGSTVMTATARQLLVDPSGREQKHYRSFRPVLTHADQVILDLQHWLETHFASKISIERLAKLSLLSERTLLRRFKAATGLSPHTYLQQLRIEKARGLLERTRLTIAEICWKVGYSDPAAFSRLFKEVTGLSAGEFRKRFRVAT